jgi:Uncharacterized protein conserved in bacteria
MAVYIALLRGINVGGKNMIKMADLRKMFESLGYGSVKTYIQSGNVVFKSDEKEDLLRLKIEAGIKKTFDINLTVILRTAVELQTALDGCPFSKKEIQEAESPDYETLYLALLPNVPLPEKLAILDTYGATEDQYKIIGRDIYLLFHQSIRDSKLAGNLNRLGVESTVRNFKTINKLAELAKTII